MRTIKYKKEFQDNTCFEIEIDENTSMEDFMAIDEVFSNLYARKCDAERKMQDIEEERRRIELEEKIKNNPCYMCIKEYHYHEPCKGKDICKQYIEYPF